jgi:hypothetical protein
MEDGVNPSRQVGPVVREGTRSSIPRPGPGPYAELSGNPEGREVLHAFERDFHRAGRRMRVGKGSVNPEAGSELPQDVVDLAGPERHELRVDAITLDGIAGSREVREDGDNEGEFLRLGSRLVTEPHPGRSLLAHHDAPTVTSAQRIMARFDPPSEALQGGQWPLSSRSRSSGTLAPGNRDTMARANSCE